MAEQTNTSLQEMLDQAIENERRRLLLERTNLAYSKLRQNKKRGKRGEPSCGNWMLLWATAFEAIPSTRYLAILYNRGEVQRSDIDLASVTQKHDDTRDSRMNCSMISRRNGVFVAADL
jgi:hypothetical protein